MKKALVTGATGQDGSYMCEYLLSKGYEVWGTARYIPLNKPQHEHYVLGVIYRFADMRDAMSLESMIRKSQPDEIYNFAGQVFVPTSWTQPTETFDVNTSGLARILSIVEKVCPRARIYQASSSEMYGNAFTSMLGGEREVALNENFHMNPVSPYGVSKLAAHKLVDVYRQKGMFVCSGIVFNHESPRRGPEMVTRKITRHIAAVKAGKDMPKLRLGNPDSKRDWGFAGDYVVAMHQMLQQKEPDDYVVGTGEAHSVSEFVSAACAAADHIDVDVKYNCQEFTRSNELHCLLADYSKAKDKLGWEPETSFQELVKMMVDADVKRLSMKEENVCIQS